MIDAVAGFQRDEGNWPKCAMHGLSRAEIEHVMSNGPFVEPDPSLKERRYDAVGRTREGRFAFVVFTLRASELGTLIRPISACYMHKKEIDNYERQTRA